MTNLIDAPAENAGQPVASLPTLEAASLPRLEPVSLPLLENAPTPEALAPAPTTQPVPLPPPTLATMAAPAPPVAADPAADESSSGLTTGPSSVLSPDPAMMPIENSMPALPSAAVAPPPNTAAEALGAAGKGPLDIDLFDMPTTAAKKKGGGAKRTLGRLFMVGVLGAGGWFGVQHGPDLYEEYVVQGEAIDEPEAPLSFPTQATALPPIRFAEFTLTNLTGSPETTYNVMTDFETNVARVGITRPSGPELEVLTFGDSAFIRRVDATQWYQIDRGNFPLQDRLERSDWVRHLDELIPVAQRNAVTIERSTESTIGTVPTRRLLVALDPAMLGSASIPPVGIGDDGATPPPADAAVEAPVDIDALVDAAVDAGVVPPVGVEVDAAPELRTEPTPAPSRPAAAVNPDTASYIEIWIDADGVVRQISGAPQLGAETITVVATNNEAWVPAYPTPEQVVPLTAAALVELAL